MTEIRPRVIPCLLLSGNTLVKTVQFQSARYVGDPVNVVNIFNELRIDELFVLDILASREARPPSYDLISQIASEAFIPLGIGGGIASVKQGEEILKRGVEKVVINSAAAKEPGLITAMAKEFGSQAVVVSIDARRELGSAMARVPRESKASGLTALEWALEAERAGAGEILLQSVDRDGTYQGYDQELVKELSSELGIPLVACGGARNISDLVSVVKEAGASAAAAGSLFVFQGKGGGVLVNYPSELELSFN